MDRLHRLLKDYYSRECSMNRIYCSIAQQVSKDDSHDPILDVFMMVINYLIFDTYKNVVVLGEMLSKLKDKSMYEAVSDIDSSSSMLMNINRVYGGEDIPNLLSTILCIEKSLSHSIIHDYIEYYEGNNYNYNYSGNYNGNDGVYPTLNGIDEQLKYHIKSILHAITIDIEERLYMLSALARVAHATIFCTCGYELPRLVSIDVKGGTCSSKSKSMILTIHCPRCGRAYHSIVDCNSRCDGRECSNDLHCYS
ncbi:MAG: hypothetical protein ACK4FV_01405 [Candidatus Nitrosocaldus sp.]